MLQVSLRVNCPCCGFPTLAKRAAYEICELCNWEDDGQDDRSADEIWGGPNADYSLSEARSNFSQYRVMYIPGRDQRITGPDSQLEYDTKGQLIKLFIHWSKASGDVERIHIEAGIETLENILADETARQIREWEQKNSVD